jgi:signal transduction histidine kinase
LISFSLDFSFKDLNNRLRILTKSAVLIIALLLALSLMGDGLLSGFSSFGKDRIIAFGNLYPVYVAFITISFILGLAILYSQYRKETEIIKKKQFQYIFIGILLTIVGSIFTNLVLPSFGNFDFYWLGPIFTLLMAASFTISILRYQLFNTKVITTELLVFILWLFIFIRALITRDSQEIALNLSLLLLTVVVGIFLIRSVLKEVAQRERIEALAKDLQQANDRLTELDRQKSEFVSFATHQLRAPLTAMKGYASLILEGDMGAISDASRDALTRIYDSSKTLTNIVEDYLNITRIELGSMKYAFESISLRSLVEDVIAELKPNTEKSGLEFTFKADMPDANYRVIGDRDKLKQVIANLIDNAVKYTPSGWVHVTLSMDRAKHKFLLTIKDSGIGISLETLPLLFQKFSRSHNANKVNIKGTGLGLFVAREIIMAHHGTIRAESEGEGKGSTFVIELEPFAKA